MDDVDRGQRRWVAMPHAPFTATRRAVLRGAVGVVGLGELAAGTRVLTASASPSPVGAAPAKAAPAALQDEVAVFPLPGSRTASPSTEITFRGVSALALAAMTVVGARSGGHTGVLVPHADGHGASYLPDAPFQSGEEVTVQTGLHGPAAAMATVRFTTATPVAAPPIAKSRNTSHPKYAMRFRSRPDLQPPPITVTTPAHLTAPGYVVAGARLPDGADGPLLVDDRGQPVWFNPMTVDVASIGDVRVQHYRRQPVLSWWQGVSAAGHGLGHYVMVDQTYRQVAAVHVGNGYAGGDGHEVLLSPQDTLLVTVYNPVHWDLSSVGGPQDGLVMDGIVQELEIPSGRVLFEWHSLDHVGLGESDLTAPRDATTVHDYFHINSIAVDHDDNLVVSARHTSAIYKIHRQTGEILWRLNGKRSSFKMGAGTATVFQHDARILPSGELTIFDNATAGSASPPPSRGIVVRLDLARMTATLVRQYIHPDHLSTAAQGNMEVLPNGNVFIGWGDLPIFSEFAADGTLLFDARFPGGDYSYRAYRYPWTGRPADAPAVAAARAASAGMTVYASWNGATEVASWQVLAGPAPDQLEAAGSAMRTGFETAIAVDSVAAYAAVRAKDARGRVLGISPAVATGA